VIHAIQSDIGKDRWANSYNDKNDKAIDDAFCSISNDEQLIICYFMLDFSKSAALVINTLDGTVAKYMMFNGDSF